MQVLAVNHVDAADRRSLLPNDWEVWETNTRIGVTYFDLARAAVVDGWGLETVVVQDDVRGDFFEVDEFTVYGTQVGDHICPKAFAADPETWLDLAKKWSRSPESLCSLFASVVRKRNAPVLNVVEEIH